MVPSPTMSSEDDSSSDEPRKRKKARRSTRGQKRKHSTFDGIDDTDLAIEQHLSNPEDDAVGIIERVTLKNFMCHRNLEFTFGPHINFVIGRNGSGKSAVLNGIILGLGGKSVVTGRSGNIKGFIQEGRDHALISVTIKNTGLDAYRYSDYGPRIIVERRITSDGQSVYKLKGHGGQLISSKREELSNILDSINIQIDNPVAILTQDASRTFLGSKDARKKYQFFWKATQMEKVSKQYEDAKREIEEAKERLKFKEKTLPESQKEVRIWEERQKNLQTLSEQESNIQHLENELVWAIAAEAESLEAENFALKEKCVKVLARSEADMAEYRKQECQKKSKAKDLLQQKEERDQELSAMLEDVTVLKDRIITSTLDIRNYQNMVNQNEHALKQNDLEIKSLEKYLEDIRRRCDEDNADEQRRQHELNQCKAYKQSLEAKANEYVQGMAVISDEINRALEPKKMDIMHEISAYNFKIRNKEGELQQMKASHSEKAALFGHAMPELLKRINHHVASFKKKPLGPIGMYLKVRDPKWSFAVEYSLSFYLHSFCCDNEHDRALLLNIMNSVPGLQMKPSIIVSKFLPEVYDVSKHRVVCDRHPSVLDVISCDEPPILNCLIDQANIERMLLIENAGEATNIMMDSPPKNCLSAFTLVGDRLYPEPRFRYYSCRKSPNVSYLRECYTVEDIQEKYKEIQFLKKKVEECSKELNLKDAEIKERRERYSALAKAQQENQRLITRSAEKIRELESMRVSYDDITNCERELENKLRDKTAVQLKLEQLKIELKAKMAEQDKDKKQMVLKKVLLGGKTQEVQRIEEEHMNCQREEFALSEKIKEIHSVISSNKDKLKQAEDLWKEARSDAQKRVERASDLCPRIHSERKPNTIENEIAEMKKVIEEHTRLLNREEINKNYVEYKKRFETMKREINELKLLIRSMEEKIPKRMKKLEKMRTDVTMQVQHLFQKNMHTRKYQGTLKFDHPNEVLEIQANSRQIAGTSVHKTTMLSGGERSYVTVSLLLSLYNVTEVPFHILDEYDVFMDAVNKDMSMKIMLDMARSQKKNQFIFLSPLELSSVIGSDVKVHKMPDPERSKVQRNSQN